MIECDSMNVERGNKFIVIFSLGPFRVKKQKTNLI